MRGILLAGGNGTRLRPLTRVMNKHLLPVFDRPMIMYPLDTLKALGIKDILIVTGGEYVGVFNDFFGGGEDFGVHLTYRVQAKAGGIAEALGLAEDFVGEDDCTVILGDNIFDNSKIDVSNAPVRPRGFARVFLKEVEDPTRFGVPLFDDNGAIEEIQEKPQWPQSSFAVTGLYQYPSDVFSVIAGLKPSDRGEMEITDVNNYYIANDRLTHIVLNGFWSDAGTFESLLSTANWAATHLTSS